jgi:acetylornithine deacetylase/succinyl-diaminopimelate desuccinylase-like protein
MKWSSGIERDARAYARAHRPRFVAELKEFIRFPSVSAQPAHTDDVKRCAAWLAGQLRRAGLNQVRVVATGGHPIVYAEWSGERARPTILIYGHYDVQPADPLREWHSPPFSPVIRGENLYGRGASDDKGQLFVHVKAIESCLRASGALPANVKCIFEGEEETGSPNLPPFLERYKRELRADAAVISDMPILAPDRPAITYALRGALNLEVEVRGPARDLHSGIFGGAVHDPLQALCEILAGLHDSTGHIAIPGFYDSVRSWDAGERAYMARVGPSDAELLSNAHAEEGWGEPGYTLFERTTLRPSLAITGMSGGYQGAGTKSVIPARASAKLNIRLVPDQDPDEINRLFRRYLARIAPPTVRCVVLKLAGSKPTLIDRRHPAIRSAAIAYRKGFRVIPVFRRSGGTIPAVNYFHDILGVPAVLMGFGLPGDRMHAPDEKFHLPNFYNGIAASISFLAAMGGAADVVMPVIRTVGAAAGPRHSA